MGIESDKLVFDYSSKVGDLRRPRCRPPTDAVGRAVAQRHRPGEGQDGRGQPGDRAADSGPDGQPGRGGAGGGGVRADGRCRAPEPARSAAARPGRARPGGARGGPRQGPARQGRRRARSDEGRRSRSGSGGAAPRRGGTGVTTSWPPGGRVADPSEFEGMGEQPRPAGTAAAAPAQAEPAAPRAAAAPRGFRLPKLRLRPLPEPAPAPVVEAAPAGRRGLPPDRSKCWPPPCSCSAPSSANIILLASAGRLLRTPAGGSAAARRSSPRSGAGPACSGHARAWLWGRATDHGARPSPTAARHRPSPPTSPSVLRVAAAASALIPPLARRPPG